MSEFHTVEVQFKVEHESHLIKALQKLGYKPKIFDQEVALEGYQGDKREQKAHIVIPRSQVGPASNDIGFLRSNGTYKMYVSAYDQNYWQKKMPTLCKEYTQNVVRHIVANGPYQWDTASTDANGVTTIKLIVRE